MANLNISVSANSVSPTKTQVKARDFHFSIDEPAHFGGTDSAANPVEYLLGSYAGCINVMAHLIAKEQNINLSSLAIDISGNLDPDKLFGKTTDFRAGFQNISVVLKPETDASDKKIEFWLKTIEERCPVNDNLKNTTPITITRD